ncbi:MAG: class I SAM-dependent methyltransferase, partial [Aggregatilineales bacterium]
QSRPPAPDLTLYDCSCGIGTQAIGLALQGYTVHATDISPLSVERAQKEASALGLNMTFGVADFRSLTDDVDGKFDVVLSCDNALPHLLTEDDLALAAQNLFSKVKSGGLLLISIRDYDELLKARPHTTPITVLDNVDGNRRIRFQVWDWQGDSPIYVLNQFIVSGKDNWTTHHYQTKYRALQRAEITPFLTQAGFEDVQWHMPETSGYYQPIVTAQKA